MALTPQRIWARVPSTYLSGLMVDPALELWAAEPTALPPPTSEEQISDHVQYIVLFDRLIFVLFQ
jgi:hypothetical protein